MLHPTIFLGPALCLAVSISAQSPAASFIGAANDLMGGHFAAMGDLTGDGIPDYVVSKTGATVGQVELRSGANHQVVSTVPQLAGGGYFGGKLENIGDYNGDGRDDLAIQAPADSTIVASGGRVDCFSSSPGGQVWTLIHRSYGTLANEQYGSMLAAAGDVDDDGYEDMLIGSPRWLGQRGRVQLWSGQTDTMLWERSNNIAGGLWGRVEGLGDVDGDGDLDFASAAPGQGSGGVVQVYDSLTGTGYQLATGSASGWLGSSLASADVNLDGTLDLIVGGNAVGYPGFCRVYDVRNGVLLYEWHGQVVDDVYGLNCANAGDVNGDGYDDILIPAWEHAGPLGVNQGRSEIRSGRTGMKIFERLGLAAGARLGIGMGIGDINSDGLSDFVLGAPYYNGGGSFSGMYEVFHGFTPFKIYQGENSGDQFGHALAKAGDLNGDGVTELLVGAPELDTSPGLSDNVGGLYIVDGRTGDTTLRFQLGNYWDYLGSALAVADFDLDGFNDFVIGANGMEQPGAPGLDRGGVIRLSGNPANAGNPTNGEILPRLYGAELGDNFGSNVIVIGDVNGDGVPEYAASSPNADPPLGTGGASWQDAGTVTVFDGATGNVHLLMNPPQQSAQFGRSIAGSPDFDFNNDGTPDFAIGAPTYQQLIGGLNQATGAVFVYSGDNGTQLAAIFPATPNSKFGSSIALLEDVNGDGFDDIAIGSPDYSGGLLFSGRVQLFLGFAFPGLPLEHWQIVGAFTNQLGGTLAAGGDWDGDSDPDIIASATGANLQGNNTGAVWILDAATGTKLHVIDGKSAGSKFGNSASFVGDLDGDGRDDLLVGDQDQQSAGSASLIRSGQSRVQSYGIGCGPAGLIPTLTGVGTPTVGSANFALKTDNAYPGGLSLLFVALAQTAIPIQGCTLLLLQPVSMGGYTSFNPASPPVVPFGIPNNAALVGMRAYFQGVVVHPGAPFLNLGSLTNGVEATIGS